MQTRNSLILANTMGMKKERQKRQDEGGVPNPRDPKVRGEQWADKSG